MNTPSFLVGLVEQQLDGLVDFSIIFYFFANFNRDAKARTNIERDICNTDQSKKITYEPRLQERKIHTFLKFPIIGLFEL